MPIDLGSPVNQQYPLNRSLRGWWLSIPGRSGLLTWRDLVGGKSSVLTNGASWGASRGRPGGMGPSTSFDGSNDYATIPGSIANIQGDITVSCWWYPIALTSGNERIISHWDTNQWLLQVSSYQFLFARHGGGTYRVASSSGYIIASQWYHVVGVGRSSGNGAEIYVDGVQAGVDSGALASAASHTGNATIAIESDTTSNPCNCLVDDVRIYNRALSADEVKELRRESIAKYPHALNRIRPVLYFALPSATAYTIAGGVGSFALSGQAATLRNARLLTSAVGSFTHSGQAATTRIARLLTSAAGGYTLSGQDAGTRASRLVSGDVGSYSLAGQDAGVRAARRLTPDAGTYTLTGNVADLLRALRVASDAGSFTLNGQDATLAYSGSNPILTAGAGGFTLSGQTADFLRGLRLAAEAGTISLAGQDANTRRGLRLAIDAGTYTLSGIDANLALGIGLIAGIGSFTVTGRDAGFLRSRRLTSALGTFTLTGRSATLTYSNSTDAGPLTFTGFDLSLDITFTGFILD